MLAGFEQSTQWQCGRRAELAKHTSQRSPRSEISSEGKSNRKSHCRAAAHRLIRNIFSPMVGFMDGFVCRAHRRKLIIRQMSSDEMKISLGICGGSIAGAHRGMSACERCRFVRKKHESQIDLFAFPRVIRGILISRSYAAEAIISNTRIIHPQTLFNTRVLDSNISLRD